jgi:Uma2 family endonuclease
MVTTGKLHTTADFETFIARAENRERLFELIEGEIVEKMPTELHGAIAGNIVTDLNLYLRGNRIGRAATEARHSVDKYNDYIPDVSFILDVSRPAVEEGAIAQMPDLAVEIKSPHDSLKAMRQKARYYLEHGTRLVWLVLPQQKVIEVYTPEDEYIVGEDETLTGDDLLLGFVLAVRNVFEV